MDEVEVIQRFGLPPGASALPVIRDELAEMARLESRGVGDTQVMKALCVLLFAAGYPGDSLRIWEAKNASFDARSGIDVQLLCGAGFEATVGFLRAEGSEAATAALAYILRCDAAGDFEGHDSPGGRLSQVLAEYRSYCGAR